MEKLIAKQAILYQGRMYERGDRLPASNAKMVKAWLDAGTAAMMGQESRQNGESDKGGQEPGQEQNAEGTPENGEQVEGHMDPKQLEGMTKAELENLADDMGVDISGAKNNAERAAMIAAVCVQVPADENGSDQ